MQLRRVGVRRAATILVTALAATFVGCGGGDEAEHTAGGGAAAASDCDGFPSRDVELVVPYSTGGGFDTAARLVAPELKKHLPNNPNVVVVNREGGGGLVGVQEVAGSEPDGYKMVITEPGGLITSKLAGQTDLDPTQLTAIGQVAISPEVIVVNAKSKLGTIEDAAEASKGEALKEATAGLAAVNVVTFDQLGIEAKNVIHEGSSEAVLSIVRGDTDITVFPVSAMLENIRGNEIKPLLVVGTKPTGDAPGAEELADVPTLDEKTTEGLGAALEQHRMIVAPPGVPECAVTILNEALQASLNDPSVQARAAEADLSLAPADPAETKAVIDHTQETLAGYTDLLKAKLSE